MSWGIVAGAAVGLVGSAISSDAAGDAADQQAQSSADATAAQERMFNRQIELQQPWMDRGREGLNTLAYYAGQGRQSFADPAAEMEVRRIAARFAQERGDGNGITQADIDRATNDVRIGWGNPAMDSNYGSLLREFGVSDFQKDPGYQFRQEEGEKGLQRAAAASGGMGSGKFLKDAMRFNQGLASQEYGAAFDRFNVGKTNTYNRLASLAGIGQTAANQTGAAASNFGSQIGSNIIGAGNALAAGRVGSANAWNNGLGQATSMYQQNQLMKNYGGTPYNGGWGTGNGYGNQDYGQYF